MRLVILESPFAEDIPRNLVYARLAVRDCIHRGESPYASHLMIPGALDDNSPEERDLGIRCGYAWWKAATKVVFYCDYGWSSGMHRAMHRVKTMHMPFEERYLGKVGIEDNPH